MLRILFLYLFIIFWQVAKCQSPQENLKELADSVQSILNTGRSQMLNELSRKGRRLSHHLGDQDRFLEFTYYLGTSFFNINLDSGIYYLEDGLASARNGSDKLIKARFLNSLGGFYRKKAMYGRSLEVLREGRDVVLDLNDPKRDKYLASFNGKLGSLYKDLGDYQKSIDYQLETLRVWEQSEDKRRQAITLNDIGLLFKHMKKPKAASEAFVKSIKISKEIENEILISKLKANLAEVMREQQFYDSALILLQQSLEIKEQNQIASAETRLAIAEIYLDLEDLEKSAQTLTYFDTYEWDNESWLFTYALISGRLQLLNQDYDEAIKSGIIAKKFADSIHSDSHLIQVFNHLSSAYYASDQLVQAYDMLREAGNRKELLLNKENIRSVENARVIYETEKKEAAIRDLTSENQIQELELGQRNLMLWIVGIAFFSSLLVGYLIYSQRLVRRKKEANDLKQKLLRVQLNPHFMFNSLNAIQNLVYRDADKQKTADYLARFSHLTRQILELNQQDFISLEDEIKFIENYLTIQQIRFDEPFQYTLDIDEDIDRRGTLVPPMITQPFLENAIEHGIINKSGSGEVKLQISTNATHLLVVIADNGVGREQASFEKRTKKHRSLATKITIDRLENLDRSFRKGANMSIEDLKDQELVVGTRVSFQLPLTTEQL